MFSHTVGLCVTFRLQQPFFIVHLVMTLYTLHTTLKPPLALTTAHTLLCWSVAFKRKKYSVENIIYITHLLMHVGMR